MATAEDMTRIEDMYTEDIENKPDRAMEFARELVERFHTIICYDGDRLCGSISWDTRGGLDDGVAEIVGLGVRPAYRRKGIATKLVRETIKQLREFFAGAGSHLRLAYLFMERDNGSAREFYMKLGFEETATIPRMYAHDDAAVFVLRPG
jgi:ribosomal protein S18 acetylase RimI-like enzyme